MSWVAVAGIAVGVIGAGLNVASGNAQRKNLRAQADAQELEARVAEIGVKQTAARRMEALVADIGAIRARRATQNVGAESASAVAAERGYEKEYLRNMRTEILQQRYGISSRMANAQGLRVSGGAAQLGGYAGAASSIGGALMAFGGGGGGGGG